KEIIRDNESFGAVKPTVVVVEIMGRHAGWLTAAAALAKGVDCTGCDAIYLPERVFDVDAFVEKVKELAKTRHSIVIAVSEGIMTADGKFVCEAGDAVLSVDAFGHKQLGGTASNLCRIIAKETGLKTRPIEFSTLQRAGSHLASLTDVDEAFCAGGMAVRAAADGMTAMMPILVRANNEPYINWIDLHDIHDIANVEKKVPLDWITRDGTYVSEDFREYAHPLVLGSLSKYTAGGVPKHLIL
ncbi:MAG: 6-phosphofructokinase, partial [Clostridia bacterium]|nr:6-phosphofructokinase [Clostridia bacterium]